ncbi:MAG: MerR family transcriptional regulator [Solobacterium sp.]|nr:MerR family transcriptional regulator [Solobacterium sp.]
MNIKHAEELAGITRKNIRFYEDQGLINPSRAENGYREYHEADIRRLKEIRFLRKLSVPIEEIKAVIDGSLPLEDCLTRHTHSLKKQMDSLEQMEKITEHLLSQPALSLDQLDIDTCLEDMMRLEKEGKEFMDVSRTDVHRKKVYGALLGAVLMIGLMLVMAGLMWYGNSQDPIPGPAFALLMGVPAVVVCGVILAFLRRKKEIEGGEEDEAAKY